MRSGASPVRYVHRSSPDIGEEFFTTILDLNGEIENRESIYDLCAAALGFESPNISDFSADQKKVFNEVDHLCRKLLKFCDFSASFLRLYAGEWDDRATGQPTHRRFYDEREWRIVRSSDERDYVEFTEADLTHVLVDTNDQRSAVIDYALSDCGNLRIRNKDDFARKVRTFSETFDEA